jgi:micrococcal nuclease
MRYEYKIEVLRVIDGDTVEARVDLGFHVSAVEKFRLVGIDAPERRGRHLTPSQRAEAAASTQYLIELIAACDPLIGRTARDKRGKYGRYLVELIAADGGRNLNEAMVSAGHARPRDK